METEKYIASYFTTLSIPLLDRVLTEKYRNKWSNKLTSNLVFLLIYLYWLFCQVLIQKRDDLEPNVLGVAGLGRRMVEDNLVDKNRENEYLHRFGEIEKKIKLLMIWPIITRTRLTKCCIWARAMIVGFLCIISHVKSRTYYTTAVLRNSTCATMERKDTRALPQEIQSIHKDAYIHTSVFSNKSQK